MKALKFLILLAAFAFTNQLSAQQVIVNNNTNISGNADFHFTMCGVGVVNVPINPFVSNSDPYPCPSTSFDHVIIDFTDATCAPPQSVTVFLDAATPSFTYIDCAGNILVFTLSFSGSDIIVDIN